MAHQFVKTRWSLVLAAGDATEDSRKALAELCEIYWYPVYSFIRRRRGDAEAAHDLTQEFFAQILARRDLERAERGRGGSFHGWLLTMVRNLLANDWKFRTRRKRDFRVLSSFDAEDSERRYMLEPAHCANPEQLYHRNQAYVLLERVLMRLRTECANASANKARIFEQVKALLIGPEGELPVYAPHAAVLGMEANTLKVEVCRLRKRLGELVHEEVSDLVATPEEVPREITAMLSSLSLKAA